MATIKKDLDNLLEQLKRSSCKAVIITPPISPGPKFQFLVELTEYIVQQADGGAYSDYSE